MESKIFEMSSTGGLQAVDKNSFKNLEPGAVLLWGGNRGWGPTRFCILYRREDKYGVKYDGYNLDEPEENSRLHMVESWSIKDPADKSVWHSQHMFIQPETIDPETVELYRQHHVELRAAEEKRESEIKAEADRLETLGRELWPSLIGECSAVIIAELEQDESDSMTDYFASRTIGTVILAPSKHRRDLFPEMRKAAALLPETRHFAEDPKEEHEHREKYSMGKGFYLGTGHYSGWQVSKHLFYKGVPERGDFIALAKRHDHLTKGKPEPKPAAPKAETPSTDAPPSPTEYVVTYDRDWTWIKFTAKPAESVLKALHAADGSFSGRRVAWYFKRHIEAAEIAEIVTPAPEPKTVGAEEVLIPTEIWLSNEVPA